VHPREVLIGVGYKTHFADSPYQNPMFEQLCCSSEGFEQSIQDDDFAKDIGILSEILTSLSKPHNGVSVVQQNEDLIQRLQKHDLQTLHTKT
jgi:hypothetical protein